jgi:hypothetical protein
MGIAIEGVVGATLILTVLYMGLTIYAIQKLAYLHRISPKLNTRKLFVITCMLTCLLRFMSFGSMTALNYDKFDNTLVTASAIDDDDTAANSKTSRFFDKATLVLFDFPDFTYVSAYVLLLVVWGEAYLQVWSLRKHENLLYFIECALNSLVDIGCQMLSTDSPLCWVTLCST